MTTGRVEDISLLAYVPVYSLPNIFYIFMSCRYISVLAKLSYAKYGGTHNDSFDIRINDGGSKSPETQENTSQSAQRLLSDIVAS